MLYKFKPIITINVILNNFNIIIIIINILAYIL